VGLILVEEPMKHYAQTLGVAAALLFAGSALASPSLSVANSDVAEEVVIEGIDETMPESLELVPQVDAIPQAQEDVRSAPPVADVAPATPPTAKRKKLQKSAKPAAPKAREIPLIEIANDDYVSPDVRYVTGGVGEEERAEIEAAKPDYNVYVMNASNDGAFEGDVRVSITRGAGETSEEVLRVAAGPLLYVNLPEGSYQLVAQLGAKQKVKKINIRPKAKPVRVHLGWK
jgi:hypothetical protein